METTQHASEGGGLDVDYVARLARLNLTAAERAEFQPQLAQIVHYVRAIASLDVEGIEPTSHAHPVSNVFRADVCHDSLSREVALANAPARVGDQFQVPKVIES